LSFGLRGSGIEIVVIKEAFIGDVGGEWQIAVLDIVAEVVDVLGAAYRQPDAVVEIGCVRRH
jgi:hypothetical protein